MKKREATPEQKAAAAERRARIKDICRKISALPADTRAAMAAKLGVRNTEGHELSPYNTLLLAHQKENVSIVGGFKQWRAAGRQVMKGSRALAIWIPTGGAQPEIEETGDGEGQGGGPRFLCGNVFDISQTEEITNA